MESMRLPRILKNLLLLVSFIFLTLVALEIGFRIFKPQQNFTAVIDTWDEDLGLKNIPKGSGRLRTPEFDIRAAINSKGLRDREYEYAKPEQTRRILCLGGSFTFGYGVEVNETFAKVLENLLNEGRVGDCSWEILNGGLCGSGTAHQLAHLCAEGFRYDPDLIVVSFAGDNDFSDNAMCGLYTVEDGKLVRHKARLSMPVRLRRVMQRLPGYRLLFGRSHLLTFVKHRIARWAYAYHRSKDRSPAKVEAGRRRAYELTASVFAAIQDSCARRGCNLLVIILPEFGQAPHPERVTDLMDFFKSHGITYIDLEPAFSAEKEQGIQNYFPVDGHWNPHGHRLTARILYDAIAAGAWTPSDP